MNEWRIFAKTVDNEVLGGAEATPNFRPELYFWTAHVFLTVGSLIHSLTAELQKL